MDKRRLSGVTSALLIFLVVAALAPTATADVQAQGILTQGKSGPAVVPALVGYLVNFSISVQNPLQPGEAGDWTGRVYEVPPGSDPDDRTNKVGWVELTTADLILAQGGPVVTFYYEYTLTAADVAAGSVTNNMAAIGKHADGTWSNGTAQHYVMLNPVVPPEFNFTYEGTGCLEVEFYGSAETTTPPGTAPVTIVNHTWTFGDGSDSGVIAGPPGTIKHEYSTCGDKTVTLSGWASNGLSGSFTDVIYVACPPKASAAADPGCFEEEGTAITFTGSATTDPNVPGITIVSWAWGFSDGGMGNGQVVTKFVTEPITATLKVVDSNGCEDTATVSVGPCTQAPLLTPLGLIALLGALSAVLIMGIRRKVR